MLVIVTKGIPFVLVYILVDFVIFLLDKVSKKFLKCLVYWNCCSIYLLYFSITRKCGYFREP